MCDPDAASDGIQLGSDTNHITVWTFWKDGVRRAAWVGASVLLLLLPAWSPTALGYAFILVQAGEVAVLAEMQYASLRAFAAPAA